MTVHAQVFQALSGIAGDRIFPVVADEGVAVPYVVYQVVGGDPQEFLSGEKAVKKQRRIQFSVWAKTTLEAAAVADQVENALRSVTALQTEALTVPIDDYDDLTKYRGARQDFYLFC